MALLTTPKDVLGVILSYLNVTDLCRVARVSKALRHAATESALYKEYQTPCSPVGFTECSTVVLSNDTRDHLLLKHHLSSGGCFRAMSLRPLMSPRVSVHAFLGDSEAVERVLREPEDVWENARIAAKMAILGGHAHIIVLLLRDGYIDRQSMLYCVKEGLCKYGTRKRGTREIIWYCMREIDLDPNFVAKIAIADQNFSFLDEVCNAGHKIDWRALVRGGCDQSTLYYCLKKGAIVDTERFLHPPHTPALEYMVQEGVHTWRDLFTMACENFSMGSAKFCLERIDGSQVNSATRSGLDLFLRCKEKYRSFINPTIDPSFCRRVANMQEWLESESERANKRTKYQ